MGRDSLKTDHRYISLMHGMSVFIRVHIIKKFVLNIHFCIRDYFCVK